MDRDIAHLTPDLRRLCSAHLAACDSVGLDVFVTFTLRTEDEQAALYAQGREDLPRVNALRDEAGMPPITAWENQRPVTGTLKSKHFPGPDGLSRAYDLAIRDKDGVFWDSKKDSNADGCPDYLEVARLGQLLGLECGAFWTQRDLAHYQLDPVLP